MRLVPKLAKDIAVKINGEYRLYDGMCRVAAVSLVVNGKELIEGKVILLDSSVPILSIDLKTLQAYVNKRRDELAVNGVRKLIPQIEDAVTVGVSFKNGMYANGNISHLVFWFEEEGK